MKLDKLKHIANELNHGFQGECKIAGCYFFSGDSWKELQTSDEIPETQSQLIKLAEGNGGKHHKKGSLEVFYHIDDLQFCVALKFTKIPRKPKIEKAEARITELRARAINAYKVAHNPLTDLLAKDEFSRALQIEIQKLSEDPSANTDTQEGRLPRAVAVLALDIDYFKQVNDTWGHFYGDQVLKIFARRLQAVAEKIMKESTTGDPIVSLGHPSGEEFLVTISASASKERFVEWAGQFRRCISDEPLPNETEWEALVSREGAGIIEPPPLHERIVTTSIGVTLHTNVKDLGEEKPGSVLLERADTALYRAKTAGRNQVIFFDEILSSCGRILEQDDVSGVVALDIGSNVGVVKGQEFIVYSPTYTGLKKFTVNDGRTTRTLGVYPRVPSGRVVVFESQPEISFACFAPNQDESIRFVIGSHLESVPAGSIRHLLSGFSKYFSESGDSGSTDGLSLLKRYVESVAKGTDVPYAVVIQFSNEKDFVRKYGTASLNFALAKLYRMAKTLFPAAKHIEVLDRASVGIVGSSKNYREKEVSDAINEIANEMTELRVLAGVFCKTDYEKSIKNGGRLSPENAIEFANYAATASGRSGDSRLRHFNYDVVAAVIQAQRASKEFKVAYADFNNLRNLGVDSAVFYNLGGLVAGSLGFNKEALDHYESAMKKSPKTLIYKSNYATAAYRIGEFETGLEILNAISDDELDTLKSVHQFGYVVYANMLAKAKSAGSNLYIKERLDRILNSALEIAKEKGFNVDLLKSLQASGH